MKKFTVYSELKFSIAADSEEDAIKAVKKCVESNLNAEVVKAYRFRNELLGLSSELFLSETMFTTHSSFQTHSESCDELRDKIKSILWEQAMCYCYYLDTFKPGTCGICKLRDLIGE